MLAIKSNIACLDSCRWLKPTAIKSNVSGHTSALYKTWKLQFKFYS